MAAGFISKTLSTLLSSVARWVEFCDGSSAPVHGAVMLDPDTGLVNAFTKSFSPRRYSAGYADLSPAATPTEGVPAYLTIDGVLCQLLLGADGYALQGADGAYLYGVA